MNVLHINAKSLGGGAEQFARDFLRTHSDHVLFSKDPASPTERLFGLRSKPLAQARFLLDKILLKFLKRTLWADLGVLRPVHGTYGFLKRQPAYQAADVIHLHNIHGDFFDLSAVPQISREKPVIWTLHDVWCMTGGEAYVFDDTNYQKGIAQTPYHKVYPLSHPLIDRRQAYLEKKKQAYRQWQNVTFVPVSLWLEKCLKSAFVYHDQMNTQPILNGVDTTVFYDMGKRNWRKPRLLFFNSSNPFKGTHLFKNHLTKLEGEYELWVIGQPFPAPVSAQFIDPVYDRKKLNELYNSVDILVFPSEAENFPLTVLEAMAAGVMPIASDTGGIPEQVSEKEGMLFRSGNARGLTEKVNQALSMDIALVRAKGQAAAQRVEAKFSADQMFARYDALYRRSVAGFQR